MMSSINLPVISCICLLLISCGSSRKTARFSGETVVVPETREVVASKPVHKAFEPASKYDPIQIKYAKYLDVEPAIISNERLYSFIDKWLNTPYKWGGVDEKGIDCSAFLQRLLSEVYAINIPRTSVQQFFTNRIEPFSSARYLSEGDLIFFRTMENKLISHVGLYLHNNMFVNSSSSKGVSIASLNDPYWKKRFVAAGRVRVTARKK
jgi:lipoprotein Spr